MCSSDLWCWLITEDQYQKVLADSGPDPLRGDADPTRGWARIRRSGKSIASLPMDQRVAAGVGNIFRAEVLFRHGIDPTTPGREIDEATWEVLWEDLVGLMAVALERGRSCWMARSFLPRRGKRMTRWRVWCVLPCRACLATRRCWLTCWRAWGRRAIWKICAGAFPPAA